MCVIYNLYTSVVCLGLSRFAIIKGRGALGGCIVDGSKGPAPGSRLLLLSQGIGGFLLLWPRQRISWGKNKCCMSY